MKSCQSGRSWHAHLPATLFAELLGSPLSQAAIYPSSAALGTGFVFVRKPCQPQWNHSFREQGAMPHPWKWLWGSVCCRCLQDGIYHHTESQSFQIATSDTFAGCLTPTLLHKPRSPCSQDGVYDGLWALEALALTESPSLWLLSATHSTKPDQNCVRHHQSAQCSLQRSSFWIYCVSCGFGFCQKFGVILPSSFLQPQRKH